jgi:hypothetical protein
VGSAFANAGNTLIVISADKTIWTVRIKYLPAEFQLWLAVYFSDNSRNAAATGNYPVYPCTLSYGYLGEPI